MASSLNLHAGEIVGRGGPAGGRAGTELLQTLFGVHPRNRVQGTILLNGVAQHYNSPLDAIAAGHGLCD